jgi:hypothetical protein
MSELLGTHVACVNRERGSEGKPVIMTVTSRRLIPQLDGNCQVILLTRLFSVTFSVCEKNLFPVIASGARNLSSPKG